MDARSALHRMASRPAQLARLAVLACAVLLLGFGLLALGQYGGEAGMGPSQAAAAGDGPITASGELSRSVVDATQGTTAVYLRGADTLEFRFHGDVSASYAPGDFVRMDGNKTGPLVEARAIRHAVSPTAAAAPALAAGSALGGVLVADLLVPRLVGRPSPSKGLRSKVRLPKRASREELDEDAGP